LKELLGKKLKKPLQRGEHITLSHVSNSKK